MKQMSRVLGCLVVLLVSSSAAPADQYSEMAQGLRERQYFDYAMLYLDQLSARTDLPAEVRQIIPYEKAMVLLDSSKATRLPEEQIKQLDQATAFLEQFAKESPNHPQAGEANAQRAEILLGKARVEIQQSRSPANQDIRREFQNRARTLIIQARQVFETARDQHQKAWEGFGTFVNQEREPDKYEAREQALMQLISARLNVGQCRYEEAQTHDPGSPEFKKVLNQAAEEFELLYQQYRSYTGGLYARLYEGKCFDDQGDTQKAMGIYNELLDHEGTNKNLRKLQHKTLQFILEALNRKKEPDSQVVVDKATEWLKEFKGETRTQVGLAIRWEQAVALEALGDQRDLSKPEKERLWRAARTTARAINEIRSPYSDVSLSMIQRLAGKLGSKDRKPDTFEDAQGLANQHFKNIQDLRKELEVAAKSGAKSAEEIQKLEQDLRTEMSEATEMFQLALNLAYKTDDPKAVATARLWFAYVHFWARRNYEAAILSEFVARTAPKDESTLAIDAAYLSMAAYVQAYVDAKGSIEHKMADLGFVIKACESLIARWPESDRANDAKLFAGRMYVQAKKPEEAALWFSKVPEADTHYPEAQLAAGQAFWEAYRAAMRMPPDLRPSTEQLQKFQTTAQQHLRTGINKLTATLPKEGLPPPELMDAKFSLAALLIIQGQEAEAITVLTADPQSVIKTITVSDEASRPPKGVQSREFAIEVHKLMLRAYVGSNRLDDARATMKTLETIAAGGSAGADVTTLYVDLGRKLKTELDDYRSAGQQARFDALRTSFETFLNDIYQRKEGQSVYTLTWIGETYSALGEAAADPMSATSYFDKAANALQEALRLAESNPGLASADQLVGVKTRLIHALRMKKDFPTAEKLAGELLKERKDDLNLQIETARLYQDWAGERGEEKRYRNALGGRTDLGALGFVPLSKRLHGLVRRNRQSELYPVYLDMRYQTSLTRYRMALAQSDPQEKRTHLDSADGEIQNFARATRDVPDEVRANFNALFRDVRTAMNEPVKRPVVDLEFTADAQADTPAETEREKPEVAKEEPKPKEPAATPAAPAAASNLPVFIGLGVVLVLGAGIVAMFVLNGKKKPKPVSHAYAEQAMNLEFAGLPAAPKQKPLVNVGAPREKKAASPAATASSTTAATRPAASPAPPATAAKPKPKVRPKPPPEG